MTKLLPEQLRASHELTARIDDYGVGLLWGEVRSGKTRPFVHVSRNYKRVLIVTKKDAIKGINSEAAELGVTPDVINYHSVHKMKGEYDLVVFDECHLYISNKSPKHTPIWNKCREYTHDVDVVFCSGTPTSEGFSKLYNMLALSDDSPFKKFPTFAHWYHGMNIHKVGTNLIALSKTSTSKWTAEPIVKTVDGYGLLTHNYNSNGDMVPDYTHTKEAKILKAVEHLVVRLTTTDTGHKYFTKDVLHHIPLTRRQSRMIELLERDGIIELPNGVILADSSASLKMKQHQISGGIGVTYHEDDGGAYLFNRSLKIEYIKNKFNVDNTVILSYYIIEQEILSQHFPHTGSVTKLSSGVDLSHFDTMVVFSMRHSSANYTQVRARLMNINRKKPIQVHYLISGVDEDILAKVHDKDHFTHVWFS